MDLRYLPLHLWENFSSNCMGSACTTQLFLFEVPQDHGSFEFVNQTVEKELYFDAWPIHRKPEAKARFFLVVFGEGHFFLVYYYYYHLLIQTLLASKWIVEIP